VENPEFPSMFGLPCGLVKAHMLDVVNKELSPQVTKDYIIEYLFLIGIWYKIQHVCFQGEMESQQEIQELEFAHEGGLGDMSFRVQFILSRNISIMLSLSRFHQ